MAASWIGVGATIPACCRRRTRNGGKLISVNDNITLLCVGQLPGTADRPTSRPRHASCGWAIRGRKLGGCRYDSPDVVIDGLRLAPAATEPAAASAATSAWFLRTRFVDGQRAAAQLGTVQCGNRRLSLRIAGHFHEAEASGLASEFIGDDSG